MAGVFQEYGRSLFPWMTIRANVERPLRAKGLARDRRDELVRGALEAVGPGAVHDADPGSCRAGCSSGWPSPSGAATRGS
jgi:NitT/TauT family transport system ATP-binding protein